MSMSVCQQAYLKNHALTSPNFLFTLPMAVAQSSFDGVVIYYVLSVLQMTLAIMARQTGHIVKVTYQLVARDRRQSLISRISLFCSMNISEIPSEVCNMILPVFLRLSYFSGPASLCFQHPNQCSVNYFSSTECSRPSSELRTVSVQVVQCRCRPIKTVFHYCRFCLTVFLITLKACTTTNAEISVALTNSYTLENCYLISLCQFPCTLF